MPKPDTAPLPSLPKALVDSIPAAGDIVAASFQIAKSVKPLRKELERAKKGGAVKMARAFVVLHRAMARLAENQKELEELYRQYKETEVPAAFEADGVTSIPLEEGFRVGISHTWRASIKPDMKDQAYAWLRGHKHGDIIKPTVNASTLSALAKELVEEYNLELPATLFNAAHMPNTSVTSTK